jgi:hypothetical protein
MSGHDRRGVPVSVLLGATVGFVVLILLGGLLLNRALHPQAPTRTAPIPTATMSTTPTPSRTAAAPPSTPAAAAAGFVAAFTDHQEPTDVWESTYSAYLTPQAKTAYQGTDRTQVPGTRVTGKAAVVAGVSAAPVPGAADDDGDTDPVPAIVTVPTDAGDYTVNLQQQDGRWLVVSAQLPGSEQ